MKTSLYLPLHLIFDDPAQAGAGLAAIARAVEDAGLDACNLTDHPAPSAKWRYSGGHEAFDPFAALSFMAAVTSRIRLLTHIVVLPYRNPFVTAKGLATLDVLSGGRAIFGVGAGYLQPEYAALGVDYASRGAAMDEAIAVMKQAWSGEPVHYEGRNFTGADILPQPIPVQRPHPPIWCGGNSARAIRRAAQLCDGWAPFFVEPKQARENATEALVTLDDLRAKAQLYRDELARAGRSGTFDICSSPPRRPQTCDAEARRIFIDQAGEMAAMGLTWMIVSLPGRSLAEFLDSIAWFGAEVQPAFRSL
jgi:probable F420-dependent oxidoreductase